LDIGLSICTGLLSIFLSSNHKITQLPSENLKLQQLNNLFPTIEKLEILIQGTSDDYFVRNIPIIDQPTFPALKVLKIRTRPTLTHVTIKMLVRSMDQYDPSITLEQLVIIDPFVISAPSLIRYPSLQLLQYIFSKDMPQPFNVPEEYRITEQGTTSNGQYVHLVPA
jgi:hypothetical protein